MNHKVKVIKRVDREEPELERLEGHSQSPREITTTIKLWVSEFKERRRTDEQNTRKAVVSLFTPLGVRG